MMTLVGNCLEPTSVLLLIATIGTIAMQDVIARTIPIGSCVTIALVSCIIRTLEGALLSALAAAAAVFVLSAFCWRRGWLGGGDVKLLAACALVVPPRLVPTLILDTAMFGGLLALIYLITKNRVPRPRNSRPKRLLARALRVEQWRLSRGGPLPYAVAIAAACIFVLAHGAPP